MYSIYNSMVLIIIIIIWHMSIAWWTVVLIIIIILHVKMGKVHMIYVQTAGPEDPNSPTAAPSHAHHAPPTVRGGLGVDR